jgi:hypothetical protein
VSGAGFFAPFAPWLDIPMSSCAAAVDSSTFFRVRLTVD